MDVVTVAEQKIVHVLTATPFISLFGYNFMSLNEFLETATLVVGLTAGVFAMFFQVRRWWRGRKRDKKQ